MATTTNITDTIKTFEDAMTATGRPAVPDLTAFPEDMREYFAAHYKLAVIAEALNEGWNADWSDDDQEKWFPWFHCKSGSSSFAFSDTNYCYSGAHAGGASRLCFETDAKAEYAGRQFVDLWNIVLLK